MSSHIISLTNGMKERQRWQPEEDALLRAYVRQHGPKEWGYVSERMGRPLHRDPKSCHERWKNYLRPGLKKGGLTHDEQALLISLQSRFGNKWKTIASHLPGRTPKRLGKWWEVFKEKQLKSTSASASASSSSAASDYDHIIQTFADKHVLPPPSHPPPLPSLLPDPTALSLSVHPPWLPPTTSTSSSVTSATTSNSASPEPPVGLPGPQVAVLLRLCGEVEEGRRSWMQHRKEAAWRLSRLEQQMEAERARRAREKARAVEGMVRRLRDEEAAYLESLEGEWRARVAAVRREAEAEEELMAHRCAAGLNRMARLMEPMPGGYHRRFALN